MAKRSKKKNPNALTSQQKADLLFNKALDDKKKSLDIRLNITVGIAVALCIIAFLLMPVININFSGQLSDILKMDLEEDATVGVTVNMSFLDFLTAPAGYDSPIQYLSEHTNSDINSSVIYGAFSQIVTNADEKMLNDAYVLILTVAIIWLASWVVWFLAICINRKKNKDGLFLRVSSIAFIALSILQWIVFIVVAIASASKAQIQPHISSYLIMASGVTLSVVYGLYISKVKRLNKERKDVPEFTEHIKEK
ncbi:MAG: hypothetical protein HDT32_00980 [Clostridiales bacterium]|nr:hypothetical protein [Clostridiales bacterium]